MHRKIMTFSDVRGSHFAMPVMALPSHLLYRGDLFTSYGISVPHSWDDVIRIARQYGGRDLDGDGSPEYGVCFDSASGTDSNTIIYSLDFVKH